MNTNTPSNIHLPPLLQVSEAEALRAQADLDKILAERSPINFKEEGALYAHLIDFHTARLQEIIETEQPDTTLLGEFHSCMPHGLVQTRLALSEKEDLGLEWSPTVCVNELERSIAADCRIGGAGPVFTSTEAANIKKHFETALPLPKFLASKFSRHPALASSNLQSFLMACFNLNTHCNDATYNSQGYFDLTDPITKKAHKKSKRSEMGTRNRAILEKMDKYQQVGNNHIAGNAQKGMFKRPYKNSILGINKDSKKILAVYFHRTNPTGQALPPQAFKGSASWYQPHFTGRSFGKNFEERNKEREMLKAIMHVWGFEDSVFQHFTKAVEDNTTLVLATFKDTAARFKQGTFSQPQPLQ